MEEYTMGVNYEVYRHLQDMFDIEEWDKGNPIHVEIFKRMSAELSKETYWVHPDYEPTQNADEVIVEALMTLGEEVPEHLQHIVPKFKPFTSEGHKY
jgi:hypothetical protein